MLEAEGSRQRSSEPLQWVYYRQMQTRVDCLWTGNKSSSCASRREFDGFWVMPPCVGFGNIPGHVFCRIKDDTVAVAGFSGNEGSHILLVRMPDQEPKVLPSLYRWGTYFGLACHDARLYILARRNHRDYLLAANLDGSITQCYAVRDHKGNPRTIFGRERTIYGPFRVAITASRTLLISEPFVWRRMCEYTLTGRLIREWEGVTGYAVCPEGRVYVSGEPRPSDGLTVVKPPSNLHRSAWSLLGIDKEYRLYWRAFVKRSVSDVVPHTGKVWKETYEFNQLACSSLEGRLLWQVELDGPQGVLAYYDPNLHASGGVGGGWLEIEPSGSVLAFCVSRSGKVAGGVGFYRVKVE
jgi:hypothetical protein